MSDEEPIYLICNPWEGGIVGSVEKECSECGCVIYVAPSGQQLLREKEDVIPICIPCGMKEMEKSEDDLKIGSLSAQQESELLEHGVSQDEIDRIASLLGIPKEEW